jgi:hypothetical protein
LNALSKELRKQRGNVRAPVLMSVHPQAGETPNRVLVDGQWTRPGELERRQAREQQRADNQQRDARRNERLRRADFDFGPDAQPPPDATPLERTLNGLLG